ncbi:ATP-grasp domain-containing protein [Streptomyces sp. C11-1]|uniref:ATP-grasp domain-containing protein n=1 Tax=Streptomyces durocortorensis TaxID=2811104 RepID=A0ABY9W1W0_9ACTN|nr:ATP-grasp domain-containing protein [Streptomyces durocortorensis]WNF29197.1 ATP-grasp domain-containing protein [Streptomyces durocortorensis]
MENPKQVVVVGGGPGLCDRIRQLGAEITLVDTPAGYDADLVRVARRTVLTEYDDPSLIPLLREIHRGTPFTAVLSLTEHGLLPAARIAEELGVPGLSAEVVGRTRDKLAMRARLREEGFSTVPSSVVRDADGIRAFAAEHGYPVIVKPRHGLGSEHVVCLRRADEVVMPPATTDTYIAEPFLDGPEFSVEAVSCAGDHHVLAITGKFTQDSDPENPFVEVGHVVPAPLPPEVATAIGGYVSAFLDVMGITDGCTHTEVRLTPGGPEVIETHTRVGGDQIPTLVRQATGHDLIDLLVQWSLDRTTPPPPAPTVAGAAAIRFFAPPPGTVVGVSGAQRWPGLPGVVKFHLPLKTGDTISPIRNSHTRVGYVLATASTAAQAIDICGEVVAGVRIDVR